MRRAASDAPITLDTAALSALRSEHTAALGHPRQLARFLCGLSSPAASRAKLPKHALFGCLAERPFASVLAWAVRF
jgi:ATP-dependent DNA helicase RecQ